MAPNAQQIAKESHVNHLLAHDKTPWYNKPNLRLLYIMLLPACLGVEMTSGYDGSVLNGLQSVQPWLNYFHNPNGALLGIMSAAFSIGGVFAFPFVPFCNDRWGRKSSVIIGSAIIAVGVVIQTASINIGMFIASRLILGLGIPFAIGGASQLIAELTYPKERAVLTGLFNISYYAGATLAAGVTLGTFFWTNDWSWRLPSLLQIAPSCLQLIFIWFIPESPRFLIAKGKGEQAFDILVKYHAEGNRDDAFVKAEYAEIEQTIRLELEANKRGWLDLLRTPGNRKRSFIAACVGLFSQWSGNGIVSYYLAKVLNSVGITDKKTQNILNLGLMIWNLITGINGSIWCRVLNRRTQYLFSYTGMLVVFICWTIASANFAQTGNLQAGGAVVGMIFLYYPMYNTMMPLTYNYVVEIFPYSTRAKGIAITQLLTRAGSGFNQFVNPIGLQNITWKFYVFYDCWLFVETSVIYFFYPETRGPTLEELAVIFDGPNAYLGGQDVGAALDDEYDKEHSSVEELEKPSAAYVENRV
ncbi:hexose transporter [Dacryopinax primogenitus]|uniref:Hexose transporter n=1 Tax=Dacryopinax primogenitus (strain DJM 731) TaxID=1858805 RepID=M5G7W3_DACPD|nr:hexose transporter [Dacryopinax primogenitus]EJU04844.1 hexose transporter [Dacryopinax primogenitus]